MWWINSDSILPSFWNLYGPVWIKLTNFCKSTVFTLPQSISMKLDTFWCTKSGVEFQINNLDFFQTSSTKLGTMTQTLNTLNKYVTSPRAWTCVMCVCWIEFALTWHPIVVENEQLSLPYCPPELARPNMRWTEEKPARKSWIEPARLSSPSSHICDSVC